MDGIRGFERRHENGLNTFRINGHGIFLGEELTLRVRLSIQSPRPPTTRIHCGSQDAPQASAKALRAMTVGPMLQ